MRRLLIILRHALAELGGGNAHNRVRRCVVIVVAAKDFDPQRPFLEVFSITGQGVLDHKAQKTREPLAVAEVGARHHAIQLLAYCAFCGFAWAVVDLTCRSVHQSLTGWKKRL